MMLRERLREIGASLRKRKPEKTATSSGCITREGQEGDLAKKYNELSAYSRELENRLERCLRKREPMKIHRMARILEFGSEVGGFVPQLVSKRLGLKPPMVYEYLRELLDIGMVERISRGYYVVTGKPRGEDLELEIASRLASQRGTQPTPES